MRQCLSSFAISVPDITAKIYEPSADLPDDPYSDLDHYENILADRTGGAAHRIRGKDGDWYLAVFGHDHEPDAVDADGITLQLNYQTTLNGEKPRHRSVITQRIRESLSSYLTHVLDYWEYNDSGTFYEDTPTRTVDGTAGTFEMYRGLHTSVDYQDGPGAVLTVDPTRKFLDEQTLADRLADQGAGEVLDQFGGGDRFFVFDRPTPQPVRLQTVADATVADETMHIGDEPTSVLSYVEDEYGSEYAGQIDPTEPVVKISYSPDGRTYDAAPSLLRLVPEQEEVMTRAAVLDAADRWDEVKEWMDSIHYVQLGDHDADIADAPIRDGLDSFEFPTLQFGDETTLSVGDTPQVGSTTGSVTRANWGRTVRQYLEAFGPADKPLDEPWLAVLHADSTCETALEAFETIREDVARYGGIELRDRPATVSFETREEFTQWQQEFADDVDGALAYLTADHDTEYYTVIDAVDGKPVQHLRHEHYQDQRDRDRSPSLRNTATDLASKLGVRPFLLEDGLHADVALGLSVAGDQQTTACSVTVDGTSGAVIDWTDRPHGRGRSTVTNFDHAKELTIDGIVAAVEETTGAVESLVVHRNGNVGNEEIAGIEAAVDELQSDGVVDSTFSWSVVVLSDNTPHRIYSDDDDRLCQTGAYARLDEAAILIVPFGREYIHQGTPQPVHVQRAAGTGDIAITDIGQDVFDLSFLNWWAPDAKIKEPITTRYPREMHERFERCDQLQFLPS